MELLRFVFVGSTRDEPGFFVVHCSSVETGYSSYLPVMRSPQPMQSSSKD